MRKLLVYLVYGFVGILLISFIGRSCNSTEASESNTNTLTTSNKVPESSVNENSGNLVSSSARSETIIPKSFIAKCAIASLMGRSPKIMKSELIDGIYYTTYVRSDDNSTWNNKVKFIGENQLLWASEPGRWRDNELDEKIYWSEDGSQVTITTVYSDNSKSENAFKYKK